MPPSCPYNGVPSPSPMHLVAFFAFLFGAALGLFMAVLHMRGQPSGKALGIAHGLFGLSGIALLISGLALAEAGPGWWMVAGFLAVAAGGVYLFTRQVRGEPWPGLVIAAHGGLALVMIAVLGFWLANYGGSEDAPAPPAAVTPE